MKQTITTSIDKQDYAELERIAKTEDRSVASILRKATREYLKNRRFNKPAGFNKPEAAAAAGAR